MRVLQALSCVVVVPAVLVVAVAGLSDRCWGGKRYDPELPPYRSTFESSERTKSYQPTPGSGGSGFRWTVPYPTIRPQPPRYYPPTRQGGSPMRIQPPIEAKSNTVAPPPPPAAATEVRRNAPPSQDFNASLRTADAASDYADNFGTESESQGPVEDLADDFPDDEHVDLSGGYPDDADDETADTQDRPEPQAEEKPHFSNIEDDKPSPGYVPDVSSTGDSKSTAKSASTSKTQSSQGGGKSSQGGASKRDPNKINGGGSATKKKHPDEPKVLGTYNSDGGTGVGKPGNSSVTGRNLSDPAQAFRSDRDPDRGSVGNRSKRRRENEGPSTVQKRWVDTDGYRQQTDTGFRPSGFSPYDAVNPDRPGQQTGDVSAMGGSEPVPNYQPDPLNPQPDPGSIYGGIGINLPGDHDRSRDFDRSRKRGDSSSSRSSNESNGHSDSGSTASGSIADRLTPRKRSSDVSISSDEAESPSTEGEYPSLYRDRRNETPIEPKALDVPLGVDPSQHGSTEKEIDSGRLASTTKATKNGQNVTVSGGPDFFNEGVANTTVKAIESLEKVAPYLQKLKNWGKPEPAKTTGPGTAAPITTQPASQPAEQEAPTTRTRTKKSEAERERLRKQRKEFKIPPLESERSNSGMRADNSQDPDSSQLKR